MRKLLASINNQTLVDRPELIALIKDLQNKEVAFEQLKDKKDAAKKDLKLAVKALKKQLKNKPAKKDAAKKIVKSTLASKPVPKKSLRKVVAA